MSDAEYDVVIVGGGAAGLVAALFASRRGRKTLVITQDVGGQAATTPEIENYPGIDFVDGLELMNTFKAQGEKYGAEFRFDSVTKIAKRPDGNFDVVTGAYTILAQTVILAFGLSHRHLNVPGEDEYVGKGVSYCSVCELKLYQDRDVAVIGGGSSAVQAAIRLAEHAKSVVLVNLEEKLRAEKIICERLERKENVRCIHGAQTQEVQGDGNFVTGVKIKYKKDESTEVVPVERVFVEIGYQAKSDWIKGLVKQDARNQIEITKDCETDVPGIFAAGDITTISFKQVVISAGEGAKAALKADQYLLQKQGKRGAFIDWGKKK